MTNKEQFQERPLNSDEYASLVEIMSWINGSLESIYGDQIPPLNFDHVRVLPDEEYLRLITDRAHQSIHPVLREILETAVKRQTGKQPVYSPPGSEWYIDQETNILYLAGHNIDDLTRNRIIAGLGLGVGLCSAVVMLAASRTIEESEETTRFAITMTNNLGGFMDVAVTSEEKDKLIKYIQEKGAGILIHGATSQIMVEGKAFSPQLGTVAQDSISNYIARPIKVAYADTLGRELKLSPLATARLRDAAQSLAGLTVPADQVRGTERQVLSRLEQLGIRGRRGITQAFLNGNIGRNLIREYS